MLNQVNRLLAPTMIDCEVFSALYPGQCIVIPLLLRQIIVDSTLYCLDFVDLYKTNEMNTNTNFWVFLVTGIHKEQVIQVHPTVPQILSLPLQVSLQ